MVAGRGDQYLHIESMRADKNTIVEVEAIEAVVA